MERQKQVRKISGSLARVSALSWNKSILAPYLLSASGPDTLIVNHDVRMRRSAINVLEKHDCEVTGLEWSANASYEQMRQSDATNVYLSSTSVRGDLAVWRLSDITFGHDHTLRPYLYDKESFSSPLNVVAWNPNHEGVFAVGGSEGDQIIRLYDLKLSTDVQHTIKCNTPITSLAWRKGKLKATRQQLIEDVALNYCEELISTHGYPDCEIKLWQVNKYLGTHVKYWFTKVREWVSHTAPILNQVLSPDGQHLATIGADESLRIWRFFDKIEESSSQQPRRSNSRKKFERQDSRLMTASLQSGFGDRVHTAVDVKAEVATELNKFQQQMGSIR